MLFCSDAYEKFLAICADENKVKAKTNTRHPILVAASYLGALRALSLDKGYNFDFDGFECKDYINRNDLSSDKNALIEKITQRTRSRGTEVQVANEEIEKQIDSIIQKYSAQAICNGHDVLEILSIAMVKLYASSSANQYPAGSLFNYLLMGYSLEEFQKSALYQKLVGWISSNVEN